MSLAGLTTKINTKLTASVAAATMIDLSNQRDTAAVTELLARTTSVAEDAAADVIAELGETDESAQAVSFGTKLALIDYASIYALNLGPEANEAREKVVERLVAFAEGKRNYNSQPETAQNDDQDERLNNMYPNTDDGTGDDITNQGGFLF